jgi:hypothetical protein
MDLRFDRCVSRGQRSGHNYRAVILQKWSTDLRNPWLGIQIPEDGGEGEGGGEGGGAEEDEDDGADTEATACYGFDCVHRLAERAIANVLRAYSRQPTSTRVQLEGAAARHLASANAKLARASDDFEAAATGSGALTVDEIKALLKSMGWGYGGQTRKADLVDRYRQKLAESEAQTVGADADAEGCTITVDGESSATYCQGDGLQVDPDGQVYFASDEDDEALELGGHASHDPLLEQDDVDERGLWATSEQDVAALRDETGLVTVAALDTDASALDDMDEVDETDFDF